MCQRFVERARKRHAAAEEAVKKAQSKFEAELQEGLDRLKRLREEAAASHTSSMRVDPPDEVSTLRLRSHISELEKEAQSRERGAPQVEELPATAHVLAEAEINQLRVAVRDLQRERDFLRLAKNRVEEDQSLVMSTLIDQGDSVRKGVGSNRCNAWS